MPSYFSHTRTFMNYELLSYSRVSSRGLLIHCMHPLKRINIFIFYYEEKIFYMINFVFNKFFILHNFKFNFNVTKIHLALNLIGSYIIASYFLTLYSKLREIILNSLSVYQNSYVIGKFLITHTAS